MIQPHDGDFIKWHAMSNWKSCLEVMQYTGLKDSKGKEIYEGDIVSFLDGEEWSNESGYDCIDFNSLGVIFYDDEIARFDVTNKVGVDYEELFEGHANGNAFEVVGNQFENPEILKKINEVGF